MTDLTAITRPANSNQAPADPTASELSEDVFEATKMACAAALDEELAACFPLKDRNTPAFAKAVTEWSTAEKRMVVIHMRDLIADFELGVDQPPQLGITLGVDGYCGASNDSRELAEHLVGIGYFAGLSDETPSKFLNWRALMDAVEQAFETADIAGECILYRFCDQTWGHNHAKAQSL